MKRTSAPALFFISILFAFLSLPVSGAISQIRMDRPAFAEVTTDSNGILKLEGFDNQIYHIKKKYTDFGTITNNTNQTIRLSITLFPEFTKNKNGTLMIKIGSEEAELRNNTLSDQLFLQLAPGQSVPAKASMDQNNNSSVTVSFQFAAVSYTGSYLLLLPDTTNAPRQITCY